MPKWLGGDNHLWEAVPCIYQLVIMVKTDAPEIGTRAQGEIRECVAEIVHAGTQAEGILRIPPNQLAIAAE